MKNDIKKICFIPIDNRPITYSLAFDLVSIDKDLKIILPKREHLGGLDSVSNIDEILKTLENAVGVDLIVLSADTIAYGGLVSSRRGSETYCEIKERIEKLKQILIKKRVENKGLKIFATSSIMRISNNNCNEEEKEYWKDYGAEIFRYSVQAHTLGCTPKTTVPKEILDDYLQTRKRNFEINKFYLELLKEGLFDYFVFSKDDTGEFGLNVMEAEFLADEIQKNNLNAIVKTGADEIPLGLLVRGIAGDEKLKIDVKFAHPESVDKISRYEDVSVKNCVLGQIDLALPSAEVTSVSPDFILYVNNFKEKQGDLVFQDIINFHKFEFLENKTPFIIADINNANGSDYDFVQGLVQKSLSSNLLAYSGYNTSANSIGSAISAGVISYLAERKGTKDEFAFKKALAIRLLDDWAYQADIRKFVREDGVKSGDFALELHKNLYKFLPYEEKIKSFLGLKFSVQYSLPWKRSFETEINLENNEE